MGAGDPELIRFVGRETHLRELWEWLLKRQPPSKLLTGLGGVGKTSIARMFAESIIDKAPINFERVIWLSAKRSYWRPLHDEHKRFEEKAIKYQDTVSLLRSLLSELGMLESELDDETDLDDLIEHCVNSLKITPSFLVIDDMDSLNFEEQAEAFHTVLNIVSQTFGKSSPPSRALFTSRLDLGASLGQIIRVTGLELPDYREYVSMLVDQLDLDRKIIKSATIKRLHSVTDGSPVFTASLFRLVSQGEPLSKALDNWKGSDGESVRKFAFKKEISNLSNIQLRTLFAICELKQSSLVELEHVLEVARSVLRDSIDGLRQYHLIVRDFGISKSGYDISAPNSIVLLQSLIKEKIADPTKIQNRL